MALIFTDEDLIEQGYLYGATIDLQEEESENSFSISMGLHDYKKLSSGCYVYDEEHPQFGGRVQKVRIRTAENSLSWEGLTFAGILSTKIIEPESGNAYRVIDGSFSFIVNSILEIVGLSSIFEEYVGGDEDEISWTVDRYSDALSTLRKLFAQYGLTMIVSFDKTQQKLKIGSTTARTVTSGEEYDGELFEFDISKDLMPVNHLICLGSGQLTARQVYHLYRVGNQFYYRFGNSNDVYRLSAPEPRTPIDSFLENWSISDEVAAVYDYSNVESYDELKKEGLKHFQELLDSGTKLEITPPNGAIFNIGDQIAGREQVSGIYVEKEVKKIIYKAQNDLPPSITYETDETKKPKG